MNQFQDDLNFGNRAQDVVADILRLAGAMCNKVDDRARYDFEMVFNNHAYKVEVKNEDHYAGGPNICLETRQGRPLRKSGIAWSEAQVFVHTFCEKTALFRRREMLEWLRNERDNGNRSERLIGDNNNRGFVVKIDDLMGFEWFDYLKTQGLHESVLWSY